MAGRPTTHNPVDLEGVHYYLTTKKYPETVGKTHGKKANFRRQANKFTLVDGKLHKYHGKRGSLNEKESGSASDHKKLRVIIDKDERQRILRSIHEGEDGNSEPKERKRHFGQDKTEIRLLDRYWWPGIRGDVRKFVNSCSYCQCHKTDRRSHKACLPTETDTSPVPLPVHPWEQIGIEVCHMPKSKEGFSFLAIVVDYFSVWIEAEPLTAKTPENVADFLYRLICRHGCAEIQIIDTDREYANQVSEHLFYLVGARQNVTNAYHSRASELFDNHCQMIQDLLMKVLNNPSDVSDWPKALPGVLFTFRTNALPSSGLSPFYLLYGRFPKLPVPDDNEILSDSYHRRGSSMVTGITDVGDDVQLCDSNRSVETNDLNRMVEEGNKIQEESGVSIKGEQVHGGPVDDDFHACSMNAQVENCIPVLENRGKILKVKLVDCLSDFNMKDCALTQPTGKFGSSVNLNDRGLSIKEEPEDCQ